MNKEKQCSTDISSFLAYSANISNKLKYSPPKEFWELSIASQNIIRQLAPYSKLFTVYAKELAEIQKKSEAYYQLMAIITEFNKLNNSPRMKEFSAVINSLNSIPSTKIFEIIKSVEHPTETAISYKKQTTIPKPRRRNIKKAVKLSYHAKNKSSLYAVLVYFLDKLKNLSKLQLDALKDVLTAILILCPSSQGPQAIFAVLLIAIAIRSFQLTNNASSNDSIDKQ